MERRWERLQQQCELRWKAEGLTHSPDWSVFHGRLDQEFERLANLLWSLYSERPDFSFQWEDLIISLFRAYEARSETLRERDRQRTPESGWFLEGKQIGAVGYVDRFAGSFQGLESRIPYLKELGVTYLHLMPFFRAPEHESDGGYAVSSYRDTDPRLGTMDDLEHLASVLEASGISLVADFVFNHTSDEHEWARAAQGGDLRFQEYYWVFDSEDETVPWQRTLREIFPEVRRGSFTWRPDFKKWVWTTFHSFQWDLNYRNPEVFRAMAGELLGLANRGVSVLRLDAVAFVWKELGSSCENLPQAHTVIQAFQSVTRLVCPSLLFKSEAIVHPDDIVRYISPRECQLSYNPLLMAELWEAAATKETKLLALSLATRHELPSGTSWVNYVRCHDDIGWTFADEDAQKLGIQPYDHRQFLNRFYTGDFPGTFGRGVSFQFNPQTGDRRICGSAASLAGLERARLEGLETDGKTAMNRLKLLYTVVYVAGGIPLLYLGDEVAVENDYRYRENPSERNDSRWVHRPRWSEDLFTQRSDPKTSAGQMFAHLVLLGRLRREFSILSSPKIEVLASPHPSVLAFRKFDKNLVLTLVASFSESSVVVSPESLSLLFDVAKAKDLVSGKSVSVSKAWTMEPCGFRLVMSNLSEVRSE